MLSEQPRRHHRLTAKSVCLILRSRIFTARIFGEPQESEAVRMELKPLSFDRDQSVLSCHSSTAVLLLFCMRTFFMAPFGCFNVHTLRNLPLSSHFCMCDSFPLWKVWKGLKYTAEGLFHGLSDTRKYRGLCSPISVMLGQALFFSILHSGLFYQFPHGASFFLAFYRLAVFAGTVLFKTLGAGFLSKRLELASLSSTTIDTVHTATNGWCRFLSNPPADCLLLCCTSEIPPRVPHSPRVAVCLVRKFSSASDPSVRSHFVTAPHVSLGSDAP